MLTGLVTTLVAVVPGALLGWALPPGRYRWAAWAASPGLTLGLVSTGMAWLHLVGLPSSVVAVFVFELVAAGLIVLVSRLLARRFGRTTKAERVPAREQLRRLHRHPRFPDVLSLGAVCAVTLGFGQVLLRRLAYPPGWDAMNHAILTRNMLEAGSTAFTAACRTGSTASAASCQFYPLATNVTWLQGAELSGGHISAAMLSWSEVVGPLALVVAVYGVVRALGARPVVSGAAALATAFLGPMWTALITGRPPEAFGPGLSVSIALLTLLAVRGRYAVRMGLLAGLAVGGLVMTHSYDVLFAIVLAACLSLARLRSLRLRPVLLGLGALVGGLVLSLAPFGSALTAASGERTAHPPAFPGHLAAAVNYWVIQLQRYVLLGFPSPDTRNVHHPLPLTVGLVITVVCLIASPLCLVYAGLRWARPWLATWVVWTAIAIWTSTSNSGVARNLAALWYGIRERERTMILPLYGVLTIAGACAIGLTVQLAVQALRRRGRSLGRPIGAAVAAAAVIVTLVGLASARSTRVPLQRALQDNTPVGNAYPTAFRWLAAHTPHGAVVAYNRQLEYMTWSYADYGVPQLFGISAVDPSARQNYIERNDAWNWLVDNRGATPAGCLVRKFNVAYVAVGRERVPAHGGAQYSRARLAASPNVTLVYQHGGIRIYKVDDKGRACATSS